MKGRTDVGPKTRFQYEWAAGHIAAGIGGLRLEDLERDDAAAWLDDLAASGRFGRRSIQIFRTALADAVDLGELHRSPGRECRHAEDRDQGGACA